MWFMGFHYRICFFRVRKSLTIFFLLSNGSEFGYSAVFTAAFPRLVGSTNSLLKQALVFAEHRVELGPQAALTTFWGIRS